MSPELTAKRISEYLTLGSHHNTPEGQEAIANIILDATRNLSNNLHLATETERFATQRLNKILEILDATRLAAIKTVSELGLNVH